MTHERIIRKELAKIRAGLKRITIRAAGRKFDELWGAQQALEWVLNSKVNEAPFKAINEKEE